MTIGFRDHTQRLTLEGGGTTPRGSRRRHHILRYDNAHERTKGHERHTRNGVEIIEFPGMLTLYDRFQRETEEMSPVSWDWSE